jgi:deoxyadenosine/deoxycytidine kinase
MWEHSGAIVAACALGFSIATTVLGILQRLSMLQMKAELAIAISQSRDEIYDRIEQQGREFGEIATALRIKIVEVELYVRDNFVRKETFVPLMAKIEIDVRAIGDRIETRLLRMEQKIDDSYKPRGAP